MRAFYTISTQSRPTTRTTLGNDRHKRDTRMKKFPPPFYRWRPHPWHGLEVGPDAPRLVHAFIEICPFDLVKYEVDKTTGYLRVDRPQRSSSQHPTLYGFIPRTYCGARVCAPMGGAARGGLE